MGELSVISSLLQQLLSSHNRVSLPGLGAFIVNHTPAAFTKGGKGMLPPGKQISFLSSETWNDELLEFALGKFQGLNHEEARYRLELFAKKANSMLKLGKRIEFPGFGTLRMTADGELRFTAENAQQFSPDSFGLLEIEMTPLYQESSIKTTRKVPPPVITEPQQPKKPKKRRCSAICWILLATLLLIGAGYYFHRPLIHWIEEITYSPEELAIIRNLRNQPAVQHDTILVKVVEERQPEPEVIVVEPTPAPPPPTRERVESTPRPTERRAESGGRSRPMNRYHIMVASFDNELEANQLARKIASTEGYIALVLHTGGNRPYRVSILRYNTQQEANIILNSIQKTDSSDFQNAWVERY